MFSTKCLIRFCFFSFLFFHHSAFAIVNIESKRADPAAQEEGFEGFVNVDISGDNGNTKESDLALSVQLNWAGENSSDLLMLNYAYGETANVKDTDQSFLHYRHVWLARETVSYEAFTQLETNEFTRLKLRSLLGGGIRLKLDLPEKPHSAYLGLGLFRSREDLDPLISGGEVIEDYTTRLNSYLVYRYHMNEHVRLLNMLYYQPDVSEFGDYRLLEQLAINVALNKSLSLTVSIDIAHDSRPPQNVETTDTSYRTGLEYRF